MPDSDLSEFQQGLLAIVQQRIPATAEQVATALGMLSAELDKVRTELDAAEDVALVEIEDHGRAYDQAFLGAAFDPSDPSKRVTEKVREATAREATWESRLAMEQAKAEVKRLKRRLDCLDRRLFIGQSIAKTLRTEMRMADHGQWGS